MPPKCVRESNQTSKGISHSLKKKSARLVVKSLLTSATLSAMLSVTLVLGTSTIRAQQPASDPTASQKVEAAGLVIEFKINPVAPDRHLMAARPALLSLIIKDAKTGRPVTGLRPAGWIARRTGAAPNVAQCKAKIHSYVQQTLSSRPDRDLNSYLIFALNNEPNISVIDPTVRFGGSKLVTLIALQSPGEDWVFSDDQKHLFVTMPDAERVAVIDTDNWKVVANLDAGARPTRIVLQPGGKYVWVSNDINGEGSGFSVIDPFTQKTVGRIPTGRGAHDIAFSADNARAFVTTKQAGTLSIVSLQNLAVIKEIKIGSLPAALAFSKPSDTLYIANEGDGTIVAFGAKTLSTLARIKAKPGLTSIRFAPGGRFGFAINRSENSVSVFDSSNNRLLHHVPVGIEPDQITFTEKFAYVRARGEEFVTTISLAGLGLATAEPTVARFPAGAKVPGTSPHNISAAAIVPTPEPNAVLVANPADKMIYYYTEGMAAPMGTFQNYQREPRALLVLDRSLRETAPGIYSTTIVLPGAGDYDVPFLIDTPRASGCFSFSAKANPAAPGKAEHPIKLEVIRHEGAIYAGENYQVRFKVTDIKTGQPKTDLTDLGVLIFLAPGIWQKREVARHVGAGVYEMNVTPPQVGVYFVFFQVPSLGIKYTDLPRETVTVSRREDKEQ